MPDFGLGVGMSAVNSALNLGFGSILQAISQGYYEKNLQLQEAMQKRLFDYQNEYNSPVSQMQRLSEAGLNPNLVLGTSSPSGVSSMPSGGSSFAPDNSFNSNDIALVMSQLAHSRNLNSDSNLKDAQANYYNKMSGRYDELIDWQVRQMQSQINLQASQLDVNFNDARYKDAKTALAVAQEQFTRGEINMQQLQRENIAAQTLLYTSERRKTNYEAKILQADSVVAELEAKYAQLFYDNDGKMKSLSTEEYLALHQQFELAARRATATLDIEGSSAVKWIDWITKTLGQLLGGSKDAALAFRSFRGKK